MQPPGETDQSIIFAIYGLAPLEDINSCNSVSNYSIFVLLEHFLCEIIDFVCFGESNNLYGDIRSGVLWVRYDFDALTQLSSTCYK